MSFDKQKIIDYFSLKPFGTQGWYRSDKLVCPNCGQNDEFGIKFTDNGGVMHCLHSRTCNRYKTSLYNYLRIHDLTHLVEFEQSISFNAFPELNIKKEEETIEELPIKKLPIGFKRIERDEYLDNRSFLPQHYELFKVGVTKLDSRYRDHLIFQILNNNNECIAWLARSRKSKEWHKENIEKAKEGKTHLVLRYDNSPNTDFSKILGGYNEVTEGTDTIILVEGLFDKTGVDCKLNLLENEEIKCLFTFGKKISEEQIELINKLTNVKNIYLLYDNGSNEESKRYGMQLESNTNKKVRVCEIKTKDKDPDDLSFEELENTLLESVDSFSFNLSKFNGIKQA